MIPLSTSEEEFPHLQVDLAAEKKKAQEEKKRLEDEKKKQKEEEELERQANKKKEYTFPKSKISMDAWKVSVVNEKDYTKRFDWIKNNFEPEAYSFWKLDYDKLDSELKETFQSNNQLLGFFNRCETFKNHVYCFQALLGEEQNYNVRGVWFWKGPEKLEAIDENPSAEFFHYRKLDINNEKDWQLIKDYLSLIEADIDKKVIEGEVVRNFVNFK